MLNPQSPVPLYRQLADIILAKVRSEEYLPDSRIPSEHCLAAMYGIGRPTARQAVDFLVRKHVLERKRGSGTFVRARQKEVDLFSLAGTTSAFHREGITVTTQILEKTRLKIVSTDQENPFSGNQAYFFSRLTLVKETPVIIEDIYLHPEIFTGIDSVDMKNQSLSKVVEERYFMRPVSGRQNFMIGYAEGKKSLRLGISSKEPVLVVKRSLNFLQVQNAIYSELFCRTDQFVFSQTIGGMADD